MFSPQRHQARIAMFNSSSAIEHSAFGPQPNHLSTRQVRAVGQAALESGAPRVAPKYLPAHANCSGGIAYPVRLT